MNGMKLKKILILYGSQTGTAQDVAERIWRESKRLNLQGPVKCMDDYEIENLIYENLVVFVCSTTGQGEEPDNMKKFWKFMLRKNLPNNSLIKLNYAVLGLGDSSFVKFNFVAKRLAKRLCNLGGTPIIDTGLADDQHDLGPDAVIDPWLEKLWASIGKIYNLSVTKLKCDSLPTSRWNVEKVNVVKVSENKNYIIRTGKQPYSQRNPCELIVTANVRTTSEDHFQDVRLLEFEKPNDLFYEPGDVLMLVPENGYKRVERFFNILNENRLESQQLLPTDVVQVTVKETDMPVPESLRTPIALHECAKTYWDLNAVPRRYVFKILSHMTTNTMEREKLQEFCQAQGQEELFNYCNRPKRNILEVLSDFPCATKNITLEFLFEILQPIRPRAFSIASSPKLHVGKIHVLMAVIQYSTRLAEKRVGLCSTYLASLKKCDTVYGWVRKGSFKFPPPETPVIMIGPGTGIAPFRSYINDLAAIGKASNKYLLLFFGSRYKSCDFHCKSEWEELRDKNLLTLICAFSRDQHKKVYVQHLIEKEGVKVWNMLKTQQAYIFVAGSSKNMPQSVRESFVNVVKCHGEMSETEAESFIASMEKTGRYQTETWG